MTDTNAAPQTQGATETKAPLPGTPEYNQMMMERGAGRRQLHPDPRKALKGEQPAAQNATAQPPAKVEPLPDGGHVKFYDAKTGAYNWAAHAKDAEYRLNQAKTQKPDEQTPPAQQPKIETLPAETPPAAQDDAAKGAVEKAGLDWNALGAKIASTGKLEQADYDALAATGLPKEMVDDYIALRQEKMERQTHEAVTYAGGQEATEQLMQWAAKSLPKVEIEQYNEMLAGPGWKTAIDAIKARKAAAAPNAGEPSLTTPSTAGSGSQTGYQTKDEQTRDMRDPRYRTDPAFRREVEQKTRFAAWRLRS